MSDEMRDREHEIEREIKHDVEEIEELVEELIDIEKHNRKYKLIVNRVEKEWPHRHIEGRQILGLAGSPSDWVVNQLVPGGGEDPEIGPEQSVDLDVEADPRGIKKFQTRKPKTNPGAGGLER